ncbi:hypothetical protein GCM10025771_11790 [Niveibacterium umoris]|uniref:Phage tail protein n=1 Tax=Niveibacterium umoris TaxID=1193620 RepID=A0A840BSA8_9RHOO|nr:phage tail sheath subtilisin-like domain-containing protein [Niveibacterium umoris]MBB4013267.1 hypothetical protein [Niveibacterium umoris]
MPEYLAPGVYVEETSFRAKSIEGVSTTTTGFVGPCRYGPITQRPDILTGLVEFEYFYGDGRALAFDDSGTPVGGTNYMWHAARSFFEEGGKRLYISRIFRRIDDTDPDNPKPYGPPPDTLSDDAAAALLAEVAETQPDGHARALLVSDSVANALELVRQARACATAKLGAHAAEVTAAVTAITAALAKVTAPTPLHDAASATKDAATAAAAADAAGTAAAVHALQTHADALEDLALGEALAIRARFPGAAGNFRVRLFFRFGQNVLGLRDGEPSVAGLGHHDVVLIDTPDGAANQLYRAAWDNAARTWNFEPADGGTDLELADLDPGNSDPDSRQRMRILSLAVSVEPMDASRSAEVWDGLAADPAHTRNGAPDALTATFRVLPAADPQARALPIEVLAGDALDTGLELVALIAAAHAAANPLGGAAADATNDLATALRNPDVDGAIRSMEIHLAGGNDGAPLTATEYTGRAELTDPYKTGLASFEDIEDISIVAAPGSTFGYELSDSSRSNAQAILNTVIAHAARMRYRIAVLDSGNDQSIAAVRTMRARFDSTYAALYYPWVKVRDPITRQDLMLPPSGFVAGIYARNDIERAVWKAPANEVVRGAIGFELMLNRAQQEVLNPEGINCFRYFEGRGMRLWGARTISSDPEWKYVNIRRYFCYLERSIDKGTQWAVFEPNGERLWANVRRTIEDFLLNEWQSGALLGDRPEKAYFVRCDRSTMTQNDLDNGRLICLIGVAPLKPAEFVIFRIGQWTADARR